MPKALPHSHWISDLDLALCLRFNRVSRVRFWCEFFKTVSRLGDGMFWYALMALLPIVYGPAADDR